MAETTNGEINESLPRLVGKASIELIVEGAPILIELDGDNAPITAGNFVDLVNKDIYDDLPFHRVEKDPSPFVVQGGDPQGKDPDFPLDQLGTGGYIDPETNTERTIPLEIKPEGADEPIYGQTFEQAGITQPPVLNHDRGIVAMARSLDPDSASSQFYITLADVPFLDGNYAVFGNVTRGMDAVDEIAVGDRIDSATVIQGANSLITGTATTFVVDTFADEEDGVDVEKVSLRDAINQANATTGKDLITFAPSLRGKTITLSLDKELNVSDDVIIQGLEGNRITIKGDSEDVSVFNINNNNDDQESIVSLQNLTITGGSKGGIVNAENLELINSNIARNIADSGGGIVNSGTLTVNKSSIYGNSSKGDGGGILNSGELTITNSTIANNIATETGGAINNTSSGNLTIKNTTITDNQAEESGGGIVTAGVASLGNTIVAGNNESDVDFIGDNNSYQSLGGNLIGVGRGIDKFTETGDKKEVADPKLLPLGNNGGSSLTQVPRFDSDAVDGGIDNLVGIGTDQIGSNRFKREKVDIGSVELSVINGANGTSESEAVVGTDNADTLNGLEGRDTLYGLRRADRLFGNEDSDVLIGGNGKDTLSGDIEKDNFLLSSFDNLQVIRGYVVGTNKLFLSDKGFSSDLEPGAISEEQFVLTDNAEGENYRFVYNPINGRLFFDSDGEGENRPQQIARLTNKPELTFSDILIGETSEDMFLFDTPRDGSDTITDFIGGEDTLVISSQGFRGGLTPGQITEEQLVLGNNPQGTDYRFNYNQGSGRLFFDADGSGGSSAREIARFIHKPELSFSDFLIM